MARASIRSDNRVRKFVDVAKRYCHLIENMSGISKRDLVQRCAELLPELQLRFMQLLQARTKESADPLEGLRELSAQTWSIYKDLSKKLGKANGYFEILDPYAPGKNEPTYSPLAGDLAEIYGDLKDGLQHWERRNAKKDHDAVWYWKFMFRVHTGHHCTSAMRPLQELIERYHEDD